MQTYSGFRPTCFDPKGLGCEGQQDWFVGPCSTNRDADVLIRANWKALIIALEDVDPEGNDHEVHSFNHWGPGWFDIVLIRPNTEAFKLAEQIENQLTDYQIINDSIYSEEETEEANNIWNSWNIRERVQHIQLCNKENESIENPISIFAARRDEVPNGTMYNYISNFT